MTQRFIQIIAMTNCTCMCQTFKKKKKKVALIPVELIEYHVTAHNVLVSGTISIKY